MNLQRLRARAQAFMQDESRETYLAYSGQKREPALQEIYRRYSDVFSDETLAQCIERAAAAAPGSEAERAARMMLEWQIESRTSRSLADLDEREVVLEADTVIALSDGRTMPYQRATIEIANSRDASERAAIDAARARAVEQRFAPLRQERLRREVEIVQGLGIADGYNATFQSVSGVSLTGLATECRRFIRDTDAMWTSVLAEQLKAFGIAPRDATRADALALFRFSEFDDAFPADVLQQTIMRNCTEMGLDPAANGHVRFDVDDRPGKRARAFCAPVRVPEEVYLVLLPHGGQSDYGTFLHELGHALHFANARDDYPFEYRWIGDNSVTEGYAMLFDHRTLQRDWLVRYVGLDRRRAARFLRTAAFEELHFVRRYCAKLLYEIQVYSGDTSWAALPDAYVEILDGATGFRYRAADAFIDLDPRYYAARYLRAWQLQALLEDGLTNRFNEDWWRNPAAGPWMVRELFAEGQRESADEVAIRVAGSALSFDPVTRRIQELLES